MSELAARRLNLTTVFQYQTQDWLLTVGFERDGSGREVFANGLKSGTAWQSTVQDTCIVLSRSLQHGEPPDTLERLLARLEPYHADHEGIAAPSLLRVILRAAIKIERESQDHIKFAYDCCDGRVSWKPVNAGATPRPLGTPPEGAAP